ncbi:uncharacterized protein TEOVI_000881300 [Trypanosoma equiperdum]|uniref:T. brucei spp.-specific protein n=2 Tax=Trypanozoon TaxID=39700 RepID=Q38AW4_TRYB2|nr:hypothetical protein Tb10.70.0410 [Trypanosoma brucei brucei TREU927]EAN78056.1 hypothetical protein Tb10.70.0410 [Trypanosoma brucei brucei TREU927]SCU73211.1 hypothetical protein, conserved [Trypanosoma equiperdum]
MGCAPLVSGLRASVQKISEPGARGCSKGSCRTRLRSTGPCCVESFFFWTVWGVGGSCCDSRLAAIVSLLPLQWQVCGLTCFLSGVIICRRGGTGYITTRGLIVCWRHTRVYQHVVGWCGSNLTQPLKVLSHHARQRVLNRSRCIPAHMGGDVVFVLLLREATCSCIKKRKKTYKGRFQ